MGLKIYFWIYVILSILGTFGLFSMSKSLLAGDVMVLVTSILGGLALYSYINKKQIFPSQAWMLYGAFLVISFLFNLFYAGIYNKTFFLFETSVSSSAGPIGLIGEIIFTLPMYYAIYELSMSGNKSKKKKKR